MHRQLMLEQLAAFKEYATPDRAMVAQQIIDFIQLEPHCFLRTCQVGHLTGSAWLVNPDGDKVLLTFHRKLNLWLQLGGHGEGETNMLLVALREAKEESGIENIQPIHTKIFDVDIHTFPATKTEPAHLHFDIRYLLRANTENIKISDESLDLVWFDIDAIEKINTDHSLKRLARLYQSTLKQKIIT